MKQPEPPGISHNRRMDRRGVYVKQETIVLHGAENIINFILPKYPAVNENFDNCYDYLGPSVVAEAKPIWDEILKLDNRGVKIRLITDIRAENVSYCKRFLALKHVEIRHIDGVKGNFGIADRRDYFAHASNKEGGPPTHAIYSTVEGIVFAQQYLFDSLWREATPSEIRIKEIEEGILPDTIETLREPSETISLAYRLVRSAKDEILIIFHTANALRRHKRAGGIDFLVENINKYKTRVKILVPVEEKIRDIIQRLERLNGIEIRNIEPSMRTKVTILLVDRTYSLVVELKDDTKEILEEAIGLATYSNSRATVYSYVSIFESLWRQSELRMAQEDFINIAAHELRNPIQPILGLSDCLLRPETFVDSTTDNKAKQREMIEIIARNAKRLQRLTEDILDVTKIEGRTLNLNKQSFVLAETIREIMQDYTSEQRNDDDKKIKLYFVSPKEVETTSIVADQNRIKQVISNLIENALKFTKRGTITVTLEFDNEHDHMIVNVSDTGRGIDSDVLARLFIRFVTKSDRGTGLGLYICKGIIEAHGGRIWAKNNSRGDGSRGGGSSGATFSFSLPLAHT